MASPTALTRANFALTTVTTIEPIVAAVTGEKIFIVELALTVTTGATVALTSLNTVLATLHLAANGGIFLGPMPEATKRAHPFHRFETASGEAFNVTSTNSNSVGGYVVCYTRTA